MADRRPQAGMSAGIVVLRRLPQGWRCLLLRAYRNWDFPKGQPESGEAPLETAVREVREETGLTALQFPWGMAFCETAPYAGGKVARYYAAVAAHGEGSLPVSAELGRPEHHAFRWADFDRAARLLPPRLLPVLDWARGLTAQAERA